MCSLDTILNKQSWYSYEEGCKKEWLLTNGIGGYCSSTITGANDRRYHGLLVASFNPPVDRRLILAKIDESIIIEDNKYDLFSHSSGDFTMHGYKHLMSFKLDPLPVYSFKTEGVVLRKTICMIYNENTTLINYRLYNFGKRAVLRLCPLINYRDHHHVSKESGLRFDIEHKEKLLMVFPGNKAKPIYLKWDNGVYHPKTDYFRNMYYSREEERGLEFLEDHYIPGHIEIEVMPFETMDINILTTVDPDSIALKKEFDPNLEFYKQRKRINDLTEKFQNKDDFFKKLVISCDHFIVRRDSVSSKTIMAGYPWFNDWGRDAMIALPGLCLVTERFEDAKSILKTFASYMNKGLIPNTFPDTDNKPWYNTADASLWFVEAVYKYYLSTADKQFIKNFMLDKVIDVVESYKNGTLFNIYAGTDHLLNAGDKNSQLTWMDAKAGDEVFTPRHKKAVELNALWYNAVRITGKFLEIFCDERYKAFNEYSEKIRINFEKAFWNEKNYCLFDHINDEYRDENIRPNQIIALSLSYPVLKGEKALLVIDKVLSELTNSIGIKSLAVSSPEYRGIYKGSPYYRDSIYHRGTSWIWLFGHLVTAVMLHLDKNDCTKDKIKLLFEPYMAQINGGCLGNLPEISDGDDTGRPLGCYAQAWSTAEVLRSYNDFLRW